MSLDSALLKLLQASGYRSEHHRSQGLLLIGEVSRFISETGDGSFAMVLWDALEFLPEVRAYADHVAEVDLLFADGGVARLAGFIALARHRTPTQLLKSLDSTPVDGAQ
jgi:hypothetical protein